MLGRGGTLQPINAKVSVPAVRPSWTPNGNGNGVIDVAAEVSEKASEEGSVRSTPLGLPSVAPPMPGAIKSPPLPPLNASPILQPSIQQLPEPEGGTSADEATHPLSASPKLSNERRQRLKEYEENQRHLHSASLPPASISAVSTPQTGPALPAAEKGLGPEQAEPVLSPSSPKPPSNAGSAASEPRSERSKKSAGPIAAEQRVQDGSHHAVDILADPKELDELDTWEPPAAHQDPNGLNGLSPVLVAREEYIPVRVARDKLQHVCAEMAQMKAKHLEAVDKVEAHYNKMKAAAEAKIKEYVIVLTKKHRAEMEKQAKAHSEKMRRVRLELLGNVDGEVAAARDMILKLEDEQKQSNQVAEMKISHEKTLLEEQKVAAKKEAEDLKLVATEKQRNAEQALQEEREKHKIELQETTDKTAIELENAKREQEKKLQTEADAKFAEREQTLTQKMQELELKASVKQSELKIEKERVQAEAQEAQTVSTTAVTKVARMQKMVERVKRQKTELGMMLSLDLAQSFALEKEPLLRNVKELEEAVEATRKELAAREEVLAGKEGEVTQHAEAAATWEETKTQLTKQVEELERQSQEKEVQRQAAAEAHATFEAETLQKLEAYTKQKDQHATLKGHCAKLETQVTEVQEKLEQQVKTSNDSILELQGKLNEEVAKHHQTRQESKKLASLTLDGKKADLDSHEKKLAARMKEMKDEEEKKREVYEEDKARLEGELKTTAANLEASEKSRHELQQTLASAVEGNDESKQLMQMLDSKDAEVARLREVQEQQQQELEKKAIEIRDNLILYNKEIEKREAKHKEELAPLKEKLTSEDEKVKKLKEEIQQIEAAIEEQGESEEVEQLRADLQAKEDAMDEATSEIQTLRMKASQLENEQDIMRAQLASKFSEHDEEQVAHHAVLMTKVQETSQQQEVAQLSQQKLRGQLTNTQEEDGDEVVKLKNKLSEEDECVNSNMEAHEALNKNKAKMHSDLVAMSDMMREQQELESQIKGLKKVIAEKNGDKVVMATGAGQDPELKAKYDKLVAEKKKLAAQLKESAAEIAKLKEETAAAALLAQQEQEKKCQEEAAAKEEELRNEIARLEKASGKSNDISKELEKTKKLVKEKVSEIKSKDAEMVTLQEEHNKEKKEQKKKYAELKAAAGEAEGLKEETIALRGKNKELNKHATECEEQWKKEAQLRKKYFNEIQDLKGKIRVMVRCRPMNSIEKSKNSEIVVQFPDEYGIDVPKKKKEFLFDHVFNPESAQSQVWDESKHFVQSAVDGYNTCIFAYGQTGSGKTFTMEGSADHPGITPRCINEVFETLEGIKSKYTYSVSCYMLELYTDNLYDLLLPKAKKKDAPHLDIKKDAKGMVLVQGSTIMPVATREELAKQYMEGCKQRHTRTTGMNEASSRSHLVFGVLIETQNKNTGKVTSGKMSLVDLAGSERMDKTGIKDEAGQKEAKSINKSLTALGDVISALSTDPGGFIPYRNNKLTLLMSDSLGGNAKTMMIAAVSPASYNTDETVNTLAYAARTKLITNDASKAVESKEIARLKAIIAKLKSGEAIEEDV